MVSHCLPHQWCFLLRPLLDSNSQPCVMSPHAEPLQQGSPYMRKWKGSGRPSFYTQETVKNLSHTYVWSTRLRPYIWSPFLLLSGHVHDSAAAMFQDLLESFQEFQTRQGIHHKRHQRGLRLFSAIIDNRQQVRKQRKTSSSLSFETEQAK